MKDELKPRYKHDCEDCVLIGQIQEFDLYICKDTIVARRSDEGSDYKSGDVTFFKNLKLEIMHIHCKKCGIDHYGTCPKCGGRAGGLREGILLDRVSDATAPWRK